MMLNTLMDINESFIYLQPMVTYCVCVQGYAINPGCNFLKRWRLL